MLKKLVKYGNSNALILDKAILELLNMEEGSIIKIRTDGKSITLTPHVKVESDKVNETFTHNKADMEATIRESFKRYKNIDRDGQSKLEKELQSLFNKYQDLQMQLSQNHDYAKAVIALAKKMDVSSSEYVEAYKELRGQFSPDLIKAEKEIATFESRKRLLVNEGGKSIQDLKVKQQKAMEQEFAMHFRKYKNVQKLSEKLLNNSEYQHKAQLIAEKYKLNQDSLEYMNAVNDLTDSYHPEIRQAKESLKAIMEKYLGNVAE